MKAKNKNMGKENLGSYLVYGILMVVALFLVYFLMQFGISPLVVSEPEKMVTGYSCEKSGDNRITCEWSGCYGDSVVALQKGESTYSWVLDTFSGKHDFDNLGAGNYMVVFVCGNQTRILESIYI